MPDLIHIRLNTKVINRLGDDNGLSDPKIPRIGEVDADIKIGGDDLHKFESVIEASKWGGRYSLSIRDLDMPKSDVKEFNNGKVIIERGSIQDRYYPIDGKRLEHERVFASEPLSLKLQFEILHSSGMTFTHQENFIPGSTYEPNVPGSYCIDIDRSNNEFRAGKWGHLFVPELKDAVGRKIFVEDFRIENGMMKFELPPIWMRNAVYPVILDPTIGYDGAGASFYNGNDYFLALEYNANTGADSGVANTIYIYTANNTRSDVLVSMYDNYDQVGNIELSSYLIVMAAQANGDWSSIDVSGDVFTLNAAEDHYLAMHFPQNGHGVQYDAGDAGDSYTDVGEPYVDPLPALIYNTVLNTVRARLYLDFGAAVGVAPTGALSGPFAGPLGGPI